MDESRISKTNQRAKYKKNEFLFINLKKFDI